VPCAIKKLVIVTDDPAIAHTASFVGASAMQSFDPTSVLIVVRELIDSAVLGGAAGQTTYAPLP
jgi:hypothetical protein